MSKLPETRRPIAWAVAAWALLALLVGCSPATPPEQPTVRTSVGMPAGEETVTTRAGFERRMFDEWAKGRLRFTDAEAAEEELPFALKMPDASLVESPATIYVREAPRPRPPRRISCSAPILRRAYSSSRTCRATDRTSRRNWHSSKPTRIPERLAPTRRGSW